MYNYFEYIYIIYNIYIYIYPLVLYRVIKVFPIYIYINIRIYFHWFHNNVIKVLSYNVVNC